MITIPRYQTNESLYSSRNTKIFRAMRESDGFPVILKIKNSTDFCNSESELSYEYELCKTLEGECFTKHLCLEEYKQNSILVMQDDNMHPLESKIPQNGFELSFFLKIALKIAAAIEELHSQDVIHKDLNPSNIIVASDFNSLKLIDFGLASRISEEVVGFEPPTVLQGTLLYISPEQTGRVNKPVDLRSDLYSLGITFYQMIVGKLPFEMASFAELIYSHIAKKPLSVSKIKSEALPVSCIIDKLLQKSPDERYQTAAGLKEDLFQLHKAVSNGENTADFKPGQNELSSKIILSNKLYGRKEEIAQLFECSKNCRYEGNLITVTGKAGIGKTLLIRELYNPITTQNGFFLAGKFDQLNKGLAYTAIADAMENFVKYCLGQDEKTVAKWRNVVQSSVNDFGQVLTNIVSEFQKLIGEQRNIAPVSPIETIHRRNLVFMNLIKDICAVGNPLILFLDDLQWADSATLSLLEIIIEKKFKNLFIILSYRENEISSAHPTKLFFDSLNKKKILFSSIQLENLNENTISNWMNDILPDQSPTAEKLAALVNIKTQGNPFYITSLLHLIVEQNYISRNRDGTLFVDIDAVASIPADIDVVEHLIQKIESLQEKDKNFLTRVSILGNRFSIDVINISFSKKYVEYHNIIKRLISSHLLIKSRDILMFAHDRIQQTARTMLDEKEAISLHLQAGQNLKNNLDDRNPVDEHIGEYIHHYNAAKDLITDTNQRLELAKLNTIMGKRLKDNAAYQVSESFFTHAITFLPPEPFEKDYRLSIDLYAEYGETLFLNHKYIEGEKQFNTVITHSKSPLDSAKVYIKQISHYGSHLDLEKSMEIIVHALKTLGVKLPGKMVKPAVVAELLKVKMLLINKKPEDVLDNPVTDDPLVLAQMEVLASAIPTTYIGFFEYFPLIIFKMMKITLTRGNCSTSPFAYLSYALALCGLGDVDTGYSFGKAGLALMEKLGSKHLITKNNFMFGAFVNHWKAPVGKCKDYFKKAIESGLETGDYEFASYAADQIMQYSFYSGENISSLISKYTKQHNILNDFGKDHGIMHAKHFHQLLITMNNPAGDGITVSGDIADEKILISLMEKQKDYSVLTFCRICKIQLAYLAKDYITAKNATDQAEIRLESLTGSMFIPVFYFFAALTYIAYFRKFNKNPDHLIDAKLILKKLKKWGNSAPDNYLHKAQLVEAELLSIKGKHNKAIKFYEAAIENASNAGNSLDLGVACECMGRYLLSTGNDSLALIQIRNSMEVFENWGALNKSTRLGREFNFETNKKNNLTEGTFSSVTRSNTADMDIETLVGSIKSLTSDLKFDSLLETLLEAVMQSSGATRVVYIHVNQERLQVRAEKSSTGNVKIYEGTDTRLSTFNLPAALIDKCHSGSGNYVLANKSLDNEHQNNRLKSVLIIPLMRNKSVRGMVCLENDLMEDAFRKEQVQFLTLLAGQAAIALENALAFEHLNAERDYTSNIIQNAPSLICGIDGSGITTFINPVIEEITGYHKEELINKNWWELFYPGKDYEQVSRMFQAFENNKIVDYEMRLTCKNGDKRIVIWNYIIKRDTNNDIIEINCFGNDISERKRAEEELEKSNLELINHKEHLEDIVEERTQKLKTAQEQLIEQAHMAGMADVAANTIHNVGNLIASVQTSAQNINQSLNQSKAKKLQKANTLLRENMDTIDDFIANNPKGKQLLQYYLTVEDSIINEQEDMRNNINRLLKKVDDISNVIAKQNDLVGSGSVAYEYDLVDIIKNIISSHQQIFQQQNIFIRTEFSDIPKVILEKYKFVQTISSLIENATDAMRSNSDKDKIITITVTTAKKHICVKISDTGIGIKNEFIKRIFNHGFTTKKDNSGYGLHNCANSMAEMKGRIWAESEGEGLGAVFILELSIEKTL